METPPTLIFIFSSWPLNTEKRVAAAAAVDGRGEQWLCRIYSGRLQIMLSCRWMADKHGELWFLTHTDRLKPHTTSSVCKVQVRARRLAPTNPERSSFFVVRIVALISVQRTLSSQGLAEPFIRLRDVSVCRDNYWAGIVLHAVLLLKGTLL